LDSNTEGFESIGFNIPLYASVFIAQYNYFTCLWMSSSSFCEAFMTKYLVSLKKKVVTFKHFFFGLLMNAV